MKEVFSFLKNLWMNKKTRALAILMLYFFFFVFVFFFISANQTTVPHPQLKGWEALEQVKKYHYQVDMEKSVVVTHHETIEYMVDGLNYTISDLPTEFENYYLDFWTPQNLKKIKDAATLVSTNYLEAKDIYQLYSDKAIMIMPFKNTLAFTMEVYKKEDIIYKIIIEQTDMPFHLEWIVD